MGTRATLNTRKRALLMSSRCISGNERAALNALLLQQIVLQSVSSNLSCVIACLLPDLTKLVMRAPSQYTSTACDDPYLPDA